MYYRYRMYDAAVGRFGRRDPAKYNTNMFGCLYEYARNLPIRFRDPLGLYEVEIVRYENSSYDALKSHVANEFDQETADRFFPPHKRLSLRGLAFPALSYTVTCDPPASVKWGGTTCICTGAVKYKLTIYVYILTSTSTNYQDIVSHEEEHVLDMIRLADEILLPIEEIPNIGIYKSSREDCCNAIMPHTNKRAKSGSDAYMHEVEWLIATEYWSKMPSYVLNHIF